MSEIVKLPSAARRKVQQGSARAVREARAASLHPFPWKSPWTRQRERTAAERDEIIGQIRRTPELAIVLSVLAVLPMDQMERALTYMSIFATDDAAAQAGRAVLTEAIERRKAVETIAQLGKEG